MAQVDFKKILAGVIPLVRAKVKQMEAEGAPTEVLELGRLLIKKASELVDEKSEPEPFTEPHILIVELHPEREPWEKEIDGRSEPAVHVGSVRYCNICHRCKCHGCKCVSSQGWNAISESQPVERGPYFGWSPAFPYPDVVFWNQTEREFYTLPPNTPPVTCFISHWRELPPPPEGY